MLRIQESAEGQGACVLFTRETREGVVRHGETAYACGSLPRDAGRKIKSVFLGFSQRLRKFPWQSPLGRLNVRALSRSPHSFALTQVDEELAVAAIQQVDDCRWNFWTADIAHWSVSAVMHSRASRNEVRASGNESNRQCHQREESERVVNEQGLLHMQGLGFRV